MFRTVRTIAAATITAWAATAIAADEPQTTGTAAQAQTPGEVPAAAAQPSPPAASPSTTPAGTPATPAGTPATVLDTQDYEGILGKGVRNAAGEDMGRIIDIVLDKDGRPRAAIIDFGGFLGVGSRKIAVDWRALRFNLEGKPGRPVLQLTRNQVRVSPEYKPGDPIVVLGPASPSAPAEPDQTAQQPAAAPPPQAPATKLAPPAVPAAPAPVTVPAPADKPPEKALDR